MKNYKKLFTGMPIARNYNSRRAWGGNHGSNEGIRKLCQGRSYDKKLQERFNKEISKLSQEEQRRILRQR